MNARKKADARVYNKNYPSEMMHHDTKRLPLLKGECKERVREYLFIAIDNFLRGLYTVILPDKNPNICLSVFETGS